MLQGLVGQAVVIIASSLNSAMIVQCATLAVRNTLALLCTLKGSFETWLQELVQETNQMKIKKKNPLENPQCHSPSAHLESPSQKEK